jgi:hypothetical protein
MINLPQLESAMISLTPPLFIEVFVLNRESESAVIQKCIYVLGVSILSLSTIFYFGTVRQCGIFVSHFITKSKDAHV